MSPSRNFPARASPSYEGSEPSRAELGHFKFRAETSWIFSLIYRFFCFNFLFSPQIFVISRRNSIFFTLFCCYSSHRRCYQRVFTFCMGSRVQIKRIWDPPSPCIFWADKVVENCPRVLNLLIWLFWGFEGDFAASAPISWVVLIGGKRDWPLRSKAPQKKVQERAAREALKSNERETQLVTVNWRAKRRYASCMHLKGPRPLKIWTANCRANGALDLPHGAWREKAPKF